LKKKVDHHYQRAIEFTQTKFPEAHKKIKETFENIQTLKTEDATSLTLIAAYVAFGMVGVAVSVMICRRRFSAKGLMDSKLNESEGSSKLPKWLRLEAGAERSLTTSMGLGNVVEVEEEEVIVEAIPSSTDLVDQSKLRARASRRIDLESVKRTMGQLKKR